MGVRPPGSAAGPFPARVCGLRLPFSARRPVSRGPSTRLSFPSVSSPSSWHSGPECLYVEAWAYFSRAPEGKVTGSETHGAQPRKPPRESVSSCGPRTLRIQGLPSRLTVCGLKGQRHARAHSPWTPQASVTVSGVSQPLLRGPPPPPARSCCHGSVSVTPSRVHGVNAPPEL